MQALKRLLSHALGQKGYSLVPHWHRDSEPQARYLARLFDEFAIDCVFDVGANRGQYADFLRQRVGFRGRIISFEPIPELVAELRERAQTDPLWTVCAHALGERDAMAEFKIMESDRFSSFLAPDHSATDQFLSKNSVVRVETVAVRRLEDVATEWRDRLGFRRPYLKLDTQGYDLAVIRGAGASLSGFVALQSEASVIPIYEGAPDFSETLRSIDALGFGLSAIFPNNPDHFPFMVEFDCHLVNRSFAGRARGQT